MTKSGRILRFWLLLPNVLIGPRKMLLCAVMMVPTTSTTTSTPNFATFLSPLLQFYLLFCHMYPLFYNLYPLFQFIKTLGAKLNILTDTNCKKEDEYWKRGDKKVPKIDPQFEFSKGRWCTIPGDLVGFSTTCYILPVVYHTPFITSPCTGPGDLVCRTPC